MKLSIAISLILFALFMISWADAREIGFVEDFSLAEDRAEALKQLIPGSSDYYYYNCLHAQHTGDFEKVHEMLGLWIKRDSYSSQVKEILNRQALLEYEKNPDKSLAHIKKELDIRFDHRKEIADRKTDYPTTLDQKTISIPALTERAFSHYKNLQGIENEGLDILKHDQLNPDRRRDLLKRLQVPDIPGLPKLVTDDLKHKHSGGFGSFRIHSQLLKSQLDECLRLMPELKDNSNFITTYISKLGPNDDVDIRFDPAEKKAYLDRLWGFVNDLAPAQNSLKVHVLYRILDMNRKQGNYDHNLFMAYIKLPRNVHYINPDYVKSRELHRAKADLNADFTNATRMPPIVADDELVKDYLFHFFVNAKNYRAYEKYIRDTYLKDIFAETKIVNSLGDPEQWYSMIDPNQYQALKERVDLDFALTNKKFFTTGESVALDLYVKNIKTLIVKIFELNTFNYYQTNLKEVDTAVSLDGLVATYEKVIKYDDPPLHRIQRTFDFPQLDKPGVFVLEFIGNGGSSRAVIRKGRLYYVDRVGPAGHEFMVLDEANQKRPDASIWLAGREYKPGKDGFIIIPFTAKPGKQSIILKDNNFCSLSSFEHLSEAYHMSAGFYADRESLLKGFNSKVIVRPCLKLAGHPVSLSLLENVRLAVESVDFDDVSSTKEVPDFEIFEDKESVFEFQVPDNLSRISFTLKAQVQNMNKNKKIDLADSSEFYLNQIDADMSDRDLFFSCINREYVLDFLGKNGEPKPDRPIKTLIKHHYFRDAMHIPLQTDTNGRVRLGRLEGIEWIKAEEKGNISHTWHLPRDAYHYQDNIHGHTGKIIQIPASPEPFSDSHFTLLEKRGKTFLADHSNLIRLRDGFLEINGLSAGDYDLFLKDVGKKINIRITQGKSEQSFVISENRVLEMKNELPLQISSIDADNTSLKVKMSNTSEFTRLHVFASRFTPLSDIFSNMDHSGFPEPYEIRLARAESQYIAGRNIGDEYRYILARKYIEIYPGNMLNRPELLLNPWSIRKTETATDEAAAGEAFASEMPDQKAKKMKRSGSRGDLGAQAYNNFSNFDFLAEPSLVLTNLKPDKNGVVTIDRKQIGNRQQIHLIAIDPLNTVYRQISLPEEKIKTRDLRLVKGLDSEEHLTEQRQISIINAGETFQMADTATSDFEVYDSLDKVYQLLVTLSNNKTLQEFSFILQWPETDEKEKQEKYSKYACHELNFFIYHKDRKFFDDVILPYLQNKKDKTFLDHWLLGSDLSSFLEPWAFSQLNIVEKILLARQGTGDGNRIAGYVKDLYDMIPPDIDAYNHLFDTALKGRVLETVTKGAFAGGKQLFYREVSETEADEVFDLDFDLSVADDSEATTGYAPAAPAPVLMKKKELSERRMSRGLSRGGSRDYHYHPSRQEERQKARQFFQKLDKTKEWAENNYYKLPIERQNADLITANAFWNDYAQNISGNIQNPFLSKNFPYASRNFSEIMLALSVLDIPFKPGKHEPSADRTSFSLKPGSPMIVFHKEIRPAKPSEEKIPVLASQHFFNPDDRHRFVDNERFDKYIEDEFLVHTPYGCRVVLSNPTSSRMKLRKLLQIPRGAMPLNKGFYTKGIPLTLEPYATQTFEYYFYFPEAGKFEHYPVQVAKNEEFVTSAPASELNVVEKLTRTDTESWDYISQNANEKDVLEFLKSHNLNRISLDKIAFRMKDKAFFEKTLRLLRNKYTYDHTLWSYSIFHNNPEIISEYLEHSDFANRCGYSVSTPILRIDPTERKTYQHTEFRPLVNARVHRLGKRQKILNDRFYAQYDRFMKTLSYKPSFNNNDLMAITYYLLLQDRVKDALRFFSRIHLTDAIFSKQAVSQSKIQYDYLQAYLGFYTSRLEQSRAIAEKYVQYPVPRWCNLFKTIADQLDELEGKRSEIADKEDREQVHAKLADTEKSFDFSVESRLITINYRNMDSCRVNYYPMDIELLFSRNPFVRQQTDHFAFIRPNETAELILPADKTSFTYELPEKFRNSNLMVEIVTGGLKKSRAYYANSLDIQVIENYGHLRAAHRHTHKLLPGVYVKVYAQMKGGEIQFYKDGYTDLRGKFDYVSLSTDDLDRVEKFAILILSEEYGAIIREAVPPKR
ncbi:MAG: hypothetical protein GY749_20765 [Desulfobacteraceae bacterium]|nr:hypothetical protein [Desulfobacteraceae bacterium]